MLNLKEKEEQMFLTALDNLDHHLGPFHPLHINLYCIQAQLKISKKRLDEAKYFQEAAIHVCYRILGANHL